MEKEATEAEEERKRRLQSTKRKRIYPLITVLDGWGQQLIVMKMTPFDVQTRNIVEAHNRAVLLTEVVGALRVIEPARLQELVVGIYCPAMIT
eukprot:6483295-Amphidinium_carterae.1